MASLRANRCLFLSRCICSYYCNLNKALCYVMLLDKDLLSPGFKTEELNETDAFTLHCMAFVPDYIRNQK